MLGEALVRLGLVPESNRCQTLGEELDVPVADKEGYPEEPVFMEACQNSFC